MTIAPLVDAPLSNGDFVPIVDTKEKWPAKEKSQYTSVPQDQENEVFSSKLFPCPVDGCIKMYQRYANLENHIIYGECQLVEEKLNLLDRAKILYREKLLSGSTSIPSLSSTTVAASQSSKSSKGWALKAGKQAKRFSDNQRAYLNQKFSVGQETGHKLDGETVSRDMRYAKDVNGDRLFDATEFLTARQINSYFSRMAAKLKKGQMTAGGKRPVMDEFQEEDEDNIAAEEEDAFNSTRSKIIKECQLMHPLTYDTHNICHLTASKNLKKFSVSMLRTICEYFHEDCSIVKVRRKDPYIKLLEEVVKLCTCNNQLKSP